MFGFGKKKEAGTAEVVPQTIAKEMGLREYVSVDSLKAHLVDMMEENRRLKQEKENEREYQRKKLGECEKAKELALVTADEWKKRAGEKETEIKELKKTINKQDEKISELEKNAKSLAVGSGTGKDGSRQGARKSKRAIRLQVLAERNTGTVRGLGEHYKDAACIYSENGNQRGKGKGKRWE